MITKIVNFKSKKEIQDVVRILRNNKMKYAFHHDYGTYQKLIDAKYSENEKITIYVWNREDTLEFVFSIEHNRGTTGKFINAKHFILSNKSTNWIVLTELSKGPKTAYEIKSLLKGRPSNAFNQSLIELNKMGVDIFKDLSNCFHLAYIPYHIKLGFSKVYSGEFKNGNKHFIKMGKDLSSSGLIDSNKLKEAMNTIYDEEESIFGNMISEIKSYFYNLFR